MARAAALVHGLANTCRPNGIEQRVLGSEAEKAAVADRFGRGYKLLYCPWETLDRHRLVFLSLNPGVGMPLGSNSVEPLVCDERGNSYELDQSAR